MSKAGQLPQQLLAEFSGEKIKRLFGNRPRRRYYLIVCEGEKTEPNYFEAIRKILPPEMITRITIDGIGRNTLSLAKYAEQEVERRKQLDVPPYYKIWVVFDRDSFSPSDFDNAIQCIESKSTCSEEWCAAWSNEAFELWYILHYRSQAGGQLSRQAYQTILEKEMKREYKKNSEDMFALIRARTPHAIRRANAALRLQAGRTYHDMNPATTVHLLVKELLSYL